MTMVLGSRGPRSRGIRSIAGAALISIFVGPLRVAYAVSAPLPPAVTAAPAAPHLGSPGPLPQRLLPAKLEVLTGDVAPETVGRAFDGEAGSALTTGGDPIRFRVELTAPAYVDAVALWGKADGFLAVDAEGPDGSSPLLVRAPLTDTTSGWSRRAAAKPVLAKALQFAFEPKRADGALREIEIWGRAASASDESPLPDALYSRLPAGAREWRATTGERTVALSTVSGPGVGGTFDVDLGRDRPSFDRAFLVYELDGLPHFTAAMRSINGHPALGRFGVSRGAKGGLQVEEIDPASLVAGQNRVQFFPADDHDPVSYRVRNLRIVTTATTGARLTPASQRAWAALRDGLESSGWKAKNGQSQEREWELAARTKPWTLDLRLAEKSSGTLTIASAGANGRVTVRLDALPTGWHRVSLSQLPSTDRLTLSLAGGGESGAAISELAIAGSPLPADAAPRIVITYPLSGECVNHRVHARGFVVPAGATALRANGVEVDGALGADGAFAFDVSEKSLASGELAIEAGFPGGARARQAVGIGRCVDRPPVVIADDGRPRQPVDDLGAPYGITVAAGKPASLSFDGVKLEIPAGAVEKDVRVTVRPLPARDTAPLDPAMTNVTAGGQSYRFGPLGMVFKKPVRMTVPYDRKLIPAGFSEGDIRTFYFDEATHRWEQVGLVDQNEREMVAVSEHFTDFINATLPTPEHPGPQSENPTSLKNIKLADPAAGIAQIEPPAASSSGTANLHFPIETPPGRKGIEPNLAIDYNSESRNGWLGVGWDLRMSAIQIDTRFGVPRYDGTETYLLDGQALTPTGVPNGAPNTGKYFARRVEGRFDWIQRLGDSPNQYTWVITDKNGTKAFYGESTGRLSDPSVNQGNIFRWTLSRVRDVFGNEMKVAYDQENLTTTDNREPATQVYPISIDYTSNSVTSLAPAYRVEFVRGGLGGSTCDRSDVIIDGRPGFQETTRCLLKQIKVLFGPQLIRRYDLVYHTPTSGSGGKTLLKAIEVRGTDGTTLFYKHQFDYFGTGYDVQAGGSDTIRLFQPPVAWGEVKNADGSPHAADGLSRTKDKSRSLEVHAGVSLPGGPGISVGIADTQSGSTVSWDMRDFNGDGLPDGIGNDGLYDQSQLQLMSGADRTSISSFSGQFTPVQTQNFYRLIKVPAFPDIPYTFPLSNVARNIINLHGDVTGLIGGGVDWDFTNTARENVTLADIDGDGYLDHVIPGGDGLAVRLNDRAGGFKPARQWANYSVSHESCSVHNLLGPFEDLFSETVGRLWVPLTGALGGSGLDGLGNISLTGVAGQGAEAAVSVYHGLTSLFSTFETGQSGPTPDLYPVWERVIKASDPPCSPGPNNSCGGGLTIPVEAGDRLYFKIRPLGTAGGVVKWSPNLMYQSLDSGALTASQQSLREPDGSYIYRFDQSADFKLVGRAFAPWLALSEGVVRVDGLVSKGETSDEVRIRIVQEHADGSAPTVHFSPPPLAANTSTDLATTVTGISVKGGDKLSFEALSDLPVNPDAVQWRPVVTYQSYCRTDPDTGAGVCGQVTCSGTPVTCTMAGDPVPEGPVDASILQREALVFHPLFRFEPGTPTQTYVMPNPTPAIATITGTVTKSAATSGKVVVAIQTVNGLFLKHVFQPSEVGSVPMVVTTPSLPGKAQLFFTVYSDTDVSNAISWAPMVNGVAAPLNRKIRASGWDPDPSGSGVVDNVMGGGFHGWSFGDWNATKPFTESQILLDPAAAAHDFMPLIWSPGTTVQSVDNGDAPPNSVNATYGVAHLVGRGMGRWKAPDSGIEQGFHAAVGAGTFLIDTVGGWFEDVFCETEHPIRFTEGRNMGYHGSFGGDVSVSAGFNTGDSTTTVEFMDMNGDRYPDSVTVDGIFLNDGAQFGTERGMDSLPYGVPRFVRHRSVHLQGGANSGENLVMMTDASGNPQGYMGAGLGISYSGSTTETDLVDINGDGLPDHVHDDRATGDVLVRLNFGKKFSREIRWRSSRWNETQVINQQDILNAFGADLSPNSLRADDTAVNNRGFSAGTKELGGGASRNNSMIRQLVSLVDVNGDGLPDQVLRSPGLKCDDQIGQCIKVKLNLGARFDSEKQIPITPWPADALATLDSGLSSIGLGAPDALGFTVGHGAMGHVSGGGKIFGVIDIGGAYHWSSSDTWSSQSFDDVDGDGTLDQVLKTNGAATVYARLNTSGKANLLARVYRPLGGIIDLDYSREGNLVDTGLSIDNPKNQWVLSKVTVDDGRGNSYVSAIDYTLLGPGATPRESSGHYDRDERESYGYRHVTTVRGIKQSDGTFAKGDGSRVDQFFETQSYYLRGLPAAEFESNASGGVFNGVLHVYNKPAASLPLRTGTFFPAEVTRSNAIYEQRLVQMGAALATLDTSTPTGLAPKYRIERRQYDDAGNLTTFTDEGDEQVATDDVRYEIGNLIEASTHITRVNDIKARQVSNSALLRYHTATFDAGKGTLHTLTQLVSGGKVPGTGTPGTIYNQASANYTFTYDAYGNLFTYADPTGYTLKYTYDTTAQTYRTRVDDVSLGYYSTAGYDLRFGALQQSNDVNNQPETFSFDGFGRVCSVRGPDDQTSSQPATIVMAYSVVPSSCPNGPSPGTPDKVYAVTRHKDVQHLNDPIDTVTFIDGLGRVIQTKKDIDQDLGTGPVTTGMTVSGLVLFDSRGRVSSQGQPSFSSEATTAFVSVGNNDRATLFAYDVLGRPTSVQVPDGLTSFITTKTVRSVITPSSGNNLGDSRNWVLTTVTDPNGNDHLSYEDARGNRGAVREFNTVGTSSTLTPITTKYGYDPLGQLLSVTDYSGNVTNSDYDSEGRMVNVVSSDTGWIELRYDLNGNLKEKQTPTLRALSKIIAYGYDFNRLKTVTYPNLPQVVYSYGNAASRGDAFGNVAGRITQVTHEAGNETRTYDRLGNVNKTVTTLNRMASTPGVPTSIAFTMKYSYDWLGRMQSMTFPNWIQSNYQILAGEGELVSYVYDHGGSLDRITGFHQTANPQQTSHPRNFTYLSHVGYDPFGKQTLLTAGNGIANRYLYDNYSRRLVEIQADSRGTLEIQQNKPATPFHRLRYAYDKNGNVTQFVNNVSVRPHLNAGVFVGPMEVTYTYDKLNQLRTMTGKYRPHVAYGYEYADTYTYDELGNIKTKAQSQNRLVWDNQTVNVNDANPVVTQLAGSRFDHNVITPTYGLEYQYQSSKTHAASPILETLPGQQPFPRAITYDANGNNTGNTFRGGTLVQAWDDENRLKEVDRNGGMLVKYRYDEQGERKKRQSSVGDTWYVNQYFALSPGNNPTKHIFAGDMRIATKTDAISMQTPILSFYHSDHLGTTGYTSVVSQNLVQHERYFASGEPWRANGEQEETDLSANARRDWLFTGKEWDTDANLYYFGARYFDPHTNVWQSPDPMLATYMQGRVNGGVFAPRNLGLYTYSWNNPIVLSDPDGRAFGVATAVGCAAGGPLVGCIGGGVVELLEAMGLGAVAGTILGAAVSSSNISDQAADPYAQMAEDIARLRSPELFNDRGPSAFMNENGSGKAPSGPRSSSQGPSATSGSSPQPDPRRPPGGRTAPLTRKEATDQAAKLGYSPTKDAPFKSHGQAVFKKGNTYISADKDIHKGGTWKMYDAKGNRTGTYNDDLTKKIGK
jgi:RHS repeat-associated protein